MLSILIPVLATAFVIWLMAKRRRETTAKRRHNAYQSIEPSKLGWFFYPALTLTLAFGLMVLVSLAYTEIFSTADYKVNEAGGARIVQLNDTVGTGGEIRGSFFLGIGSVSGQFGPEIAYSFYEHVPGGDLRGQTLTDDRWDQVYVRERDGVVPHYTYEQGEDPCHTPGWLNPIHELCGSTQYETEWIITVPKGTVLHGYSLDAR